MNAGRSERVASRRTAKARSTQFSVARRARMLQQRALTDVHLGCPWLSSVRVFDLRLSSERPDEGQEGGIPMAGASRGMTGKRS
jgi:hypothetical protein